MPSQRQGDEVIGREAKLVTVMASSSANVEAPPTAGVQLTERPLAEEVPAGVHPGALSSRAGVGDTNAASAGDTNTTKKRHIRDILGRTNFFLSYI